MEKSEITKDDCIQFANIFATKINSGLLNLMRSCSNVPSTKSLRKKSLQLAKIDISKDRVTEISVISIKFEEFILIDKICMIDKKITKYKKFIR